MFPLSRNFLWKSQFRIHESYSVYLTIDEPAEHIFLDDSVSLCSKKLNLVSYRALRAKFGINSMALKGIRASISLVEWNIYISGNENN